MSSRLKFIRKCHLINPFAPPSPTSGEGAGGEVNNQNFFLSFPTYPMGKGV